MQRPLLRAIFLLLALLALPVATYAQSGQVRAVNLCPDAPPLDMYIGDTLAPAFPNLMFPSASGTVDKAAELTQVQVTMAGMRNQIFVDANINVAADSRTNILIMNRFNAIEAVTLLFNTSLQTRPDSAYLRFLNASPNGGNLDIEVTNSNGGVRKLTNIPFKGVTQFISVPVGTVKVRLFKAGTQTLLLRVGKSLSGGIYGTVIVTGISPTFQVQLLDETSQNPQIPLGRFDPVSDIAKFKLRAVQCVPDAPPVDIFVDSTRVMDGLRFNDASSMLDLDSGNYKLSIGPTGQPVGNTVVSTNLSFKPDSIYTMISVGMISKATLGLQILSRPLTLSVANDSALVRILHASPDAGPVDITLTNSAGGTTNLPGVAFKGTAGYLRLPAGTIDVDIAMAGGPIFYSASGVLAPGSMVTLITTGNLADTFKVSVLIDNDNAQQKPMQELTPVVPAGQAALRLVHCSPDAGGIDIFVANDSINPVTLNFREAGSVLEGPAGPVNIKVAPQGAGIGLAVVEDDITLPEQALTTLVAMGSLAQFNLSVETLISTDADTAKPGMVSLRILHASSDAGNADILLTKSDNATQQFNGVAFKDVVAYMQVPGGKTSFKIFPAGSTTATISVSGMIPTGSIATAIITGSATGGTLGVNVLFDDLDQAQKPMMLMTSDVVSVDRTNASSHAMSVAPNPVVETANIDYWLANSTDVRIELVDGRGAVVAILAPGVQEAGNHRARFTTTMLPSGSYRALLRGADGTLSGTTMVVVH